MIRFSRSLRAKVGVAVVLAAGFSGSAGCLGRRISPARIANNALGPMTIAVAPGINVSGSKDVDPVRVADLMASELSYVEGVNVLPVSRVLAVLSEEGAQRVTTAEQALHLADRLGADAILVFAITEFNPYDPPVVGISAQLFGRKRSASVVGFDPVTESRLGSPPQAPRAGPVVGAIAQYGRVFDASHEWVREEVRRFAYSRTEEWSPFGWKKYLVSQNHYLRYCCHSVVRGLAQEVGMKTEPEGD